MTENRESELLNDVPDGLFIGGEWRPASEGGRLEVHDPATGQVIKQIADGTVDDGRAAIGAAADAFPGWAATPTRERAELLRRAFDLLQQRKEDFALLMTLEMASRWPRPGERWPTAASSCAGSAKRPRTCRAATAPTPSAPDG